MAAYSFKDVSASITGPGGSFQLGYGAGDADEGIVVAYAEAINTMAVGADGAVMHSLHAGKSGTVTVTLLKTSPVNQKLNQLYEYQAQSSSRWGKNVITIRDAARGDTITCEDVAFQKHPDTTYKKDADTPAWVFDAGKITVQLGSGSPEREN